MGDAGIESEPYLCTSYFGGDGTGNVGGECEIGFAKSVIVLGYFVLINSYADCTFRSVIGSGGGR